MSADSEREAVLWDRYRKNKSAGNLNELIRFYAPMVKSLAERMFITLAKKIRLDDLYAEGLIGLWQSIAATDERKRKGRFSSYAWNRIRGTMLDYARGQNRFPWSTIRQLKTYEQTVADLKNELGRQPTKREISAKTGFNLYRIDQLIFYDNLAFVPVDAISENYEGEQRRDLLIDHKPTPEKAMVRKEFRRELQDSMKILSPNERQAFELYFSRDLRLREIADRMHISEARACQLKNSAVKKLRRFLVQNDVLLGEVEI